MAQGSLVRDHIEAGKQFLRKFEKTIPVVAAYWLKETEASPWNLYVASDRFNAGKVGDAYKEVLQIIQRMPGSALEPFQVKLVGLNEPLVQTVLEFYLTHPPRISYCFREHFGGMEITEIHLLQGPKGEYQMPNGRETLNQIIDEEAAFFQQHGQPPRKIKLPVLMAYDLAKCGRNELGDLSGKVFKDGITAFEREGFHGMAVEIVRDRNATLQLE